MHFAFTEQQLELRHAVRAVLERECTVGDLRAVAAAPPGAVGWRGQGRRAERWAVLDELGATGLVVPESGGGVGLTEVELVGVLEEAGRVALPEALAEACLAGQLLGTAGRRAVGGVDVTIAGPACSTTVDGGTATTPRVAGAGEAAELVLATADGAGGWTLHLVAGSDAGLRHTPALCPTRDLAEVTWSPAAATEVMAGDAAVAAVRALADRGAFAAAAQLLGLADRMITMAAAYATDRRQFGVPVGSFQAVKHLLANARVRLEFARPVVYRAAWSLATGDPEASHHCAMAKAMASDAGDQAARAALQVHGAIGYTWECDLHFFMKRAWTLSAEWGNAAAHRALVLRHVLGRTA